MEVIELFALILNLLLPVSDLVIWFVEHWSTIWAWLDALCYRIQCPCRILVEHSQHCFCC